MTSHTFADCGTTPATVYCGRCGERRPLHYPCAVSDFVLQMKAFDKSHRYCKTKRSGREPAR